MSDHALSESEKLYLDLLQQVLTGSLHDESAWIVVEARRLKKHHPNVFIDIIVGIARRLIIKILRKKSLLLVRKRPFNLSSREQGWDWPLVGYTMIGHKRLENVRACVEDVLKNNIPGDFIETGAWRGGTCIFMRALLKLYGVTNRKVWVADSFEGLPPPDKTRNELDLSDVDYLKVSLKTVRSNFARFGLLDDQVAFLPGWFSDTLPQAPINQLAILRLDGDLYAATMDALDALYKKVIRGGYVIVDDYFSWPTCRQAVTDFLARHSLAPEIKAIDADGAYWQV